jgi:hypothetical protein
MEKTYKKLLPTNPEIAWCYVFFPALICYFFLLARFLNEKPIIGSIEIYNEHFLSLVSSNSMIEVIANGSIWSEGPIWVQDEQTSTNYLLYSGIYKYYIFTFTYFHFIFLKKILIFPDFRYYPQ